MKNFYRSILLIAAISFAIPLEASHPFAGGQGTANEPYQIQSADQLNFIRGEYLDKYFVQTSHIDLGISPYNSGNGWNPIGGNNTNDRFTGHYDGAGYTISNLFIDRPGASNIGLFGHIGINGTGATTIKNVTLENVNVIGGRGTGSLAGRVTGNQNTRIENCFVSNGNVHGDGATGGLVGSNNSYMTNSAAAESFRPVIYRCSASVSVSLRDGSGGNKDKFGGLVGCNQKGMISNSYAHGAVSVDGGTRVGGLAGCVELRGIIINSYSTGSVTGNDTSLLGGLLGMSGSGSNLGTTIDCYWDIETSGVGTTAGGTGLTSEQIKMEANFSNWDFEAMWEIEEGVPYPVFKNQLSNAIVWVWNTSASDNNWNKASNWVDQTASPAPYSTVVIPSGASHYPELSDNLIIKKLNVNGGATITINDNSWLIIKDSLLGNGSVTGAGTIILHGDGFQTIPSMVFNNLTIDNPNNVRLGGDIFVNGNLDMERGFMDLNGHIITLGESAFLKETEIENSSSRIYGENGYIQTTRMLDNPQGENIGGMGIQITANNMGSTTLSRGHSIQFDDDTSESIMRWFDITPSINTALNATLVFHYSSGEVNLPSEFDDIGFFLYKRTTDPVEWVHVVSVLDTESRTLTAENLGGFSRWTAGSSIVHLPVALLSFDAEVRNNDIVLNWSTASEINNDYFTVERSMDGQTFEPVGLVEGAGNSNRLITYTKTDPSPLSGVSYYRLKQTDFDGTYEYSPMVSVELKEPVSNMITLYPNPNNGEFNISNMGETKVPFRIYDMQGRMVFASEAEPMSNHTFGSGQLKMGLYNVVFESTERHTLKMQVR